MDSGPESEQDEQPEGEGYPPHLDEVGLPERSHADVVVQIVDLEKVLPAVSANKFICKDVELESFHVLRRDEADLP